jgi:exodeoxyribonuclease VII large subunit
VAIAETPLTVSALTQRITGALEAFGTLAVQGELSQVKVAPSGHLYATLKDAGAVISLVMWRSAVVRNGPLPVEGAQVVVRGALSVYGPRGQYQLVATRIAPQGQGDLAARFAALKARLEAEGLFAEERKRPLPALPAAIGLATAAGSAALADLLHSIRARFPRMPVVHAHCLVQGQGAVVEIVAALRRLDAHPQVEVIIVGRGGGSLEDLWAFNEEAVVRAIAACVKPVVSAVGHETDHTLADLVADLRAKTPTAAGELVVPIEAELRAALDAHRQALDLAMGGMLAAYRHQLAAFASHRALAGPAHQVALRRQRLDELGARLDEAIGQRVEQERGALRFAALRLGNVAPRRRVEAARELLAGHARDLRRAAARAVDRAQQRLAAAAGRLDALSPLAVIARGYSVVRGPGGLLVRRLDQAPAGTPIEVRLADGWLQAEVTGVRPQRLNEAEE